jgi:hypothetical protein
MFKTVPCFTKLMERKFSHTVFLNDNIKTSCCLPESCNKIKSSSILHTMKNMSVPL